MKTNLTEFVAFPCINQVKVHLFKLEKARKIRKMKYGSYAINTVNVSGISMILNLTCSSLQTFMCTVKQYLHLLVSLSQQG